MDGACILSNAIVNSGPNKQVVSHTVMLGVSTDRSALHCMVKHACFATTQERPALMKGDLYLPEESTT